MFENVYNGRKVLVTGHTGFKGSWLALWLLELGAEVMGLSLPPETEPNHYGLLGLDMHSVFHDVGEADQVYRTVAQFRPEVVFHLAAQSLVRRSYRQPAETFGTNVMGTVNVLEACRRTDSVRAAVIVTSDKCYENREWIWGYREGDRIGGRDPYSASKGCAELVTAAYQQSFFPIREYGKDHKMLVASARAGNVLAGGDWAEDRLVPDIMRAASERLKVQIRNPEATRPWQHVLEPLSGYLMLGNGLFKGKQTLSGAWNFGPYEGGHRTVMAVLEELKRYWSLIDYETAEDAESPHEAGLLKLDCSRALTLLRWKPLWDISQTLSRTALWYRKFYETGEVTSRENLAEYVAEAKQIRLPWADDEDLSDTAL